MKVVVPSKGRPQTVPTLSRLFPEAIWCLGAEEEADYLVPEDRKLIHMPGLIGIARKRQWILDQFGDETIFFIDDDVEYLWCNVGRTGRRIDDPKGIMQVVENAAHIAEELGTSVFGFNQAYDVRKIRTCDPFSVTGWAGTAIGVVGRDVKFDESLKTQADIDFCLRVLLKKRFIWIDSRYCFAGAMFNQSGGSSLIRTAQEYERQMKIVLDRWNPWLEFRKGKTTNRLIVNVPRRQQLEIGG